MRIISEQSENTPMMPLGPTRLKTFFINHLNRIYCAKSHLVERLPELAEQSAFKDLKFAITETWEDVQKQLVRMDEVYVLLEAESSLESCNGLIGMVEDAFAEIHQENENTALRDLAILFYMSNIESVEMASFQILQMAAINLRNKQVTQLLKENYDEARADRVLMLLITGKYLAN